MKHLFEVSIAMLFVFDIAFSDYYDSKMVQWKQPNGVEFTARLRVDEFSFHMETTNGHTIKQGKDGYYYYAILDNNGEYAVSNKRVGIDEPLQTSYKLTRTANRLFQIEEKRKRVNISLRDKRKSSKSISGFPKIQTGGIDTCKLAVILVDFTPKVRDSTFQGVGYYKWHFDSVFFSTNFWVGASGNNIHPQQHEIFGSLRDFYREQSYGKMDIIGGGVSKRSIVNTLNPGTDLPKWVTVAGNYYSWGEEMQYLENIAIDSAENQISGFDRDDYNIICLVYAGGRPGETAAQYPHANLTEDVMAINESWRGYFSHVGTTCHEFAHAYLGAKDEYNGTVFPGIMSLMDIGCFNGPLISGINQSLGQCPAPFSPYYKALHCWITPIVKINSTNDTLKYNAVSPIVWRINIPNSDEYFMLERRVKTGFDHYTPYQETGTPNGIYIWHMKESTAYDHEEFEFCDKTATYRWSGYTFDDLIGALANAKKRDGSNSFISIGSFTWNGNGSTGYMAIGSISSFFTISSNTTYTSDQTWSQNCQIANSVTVTINSSAELTIDPGVTVQMGSGANIVANGKITAIGTSLNKITFIPIAGTLPGSWGNLQFDGSDASNSVLNWIVMRNGGEIRCFNAANITIQNSLLSGNQNGIYCDYGSDPTIQDNRIENMQYHSIVSFGASSPHIFHNTLIKDSGPYYHGSCGLWLIGSSPYLIRNIIQGMGFGVYATWNSNPQFMPSSNPQIETPYPNNYFTDNNCGVVAYEGSNPVMGYYDFVPEAVVGGYNGLEGEPYDVAVCDYCIVYAEQNWWGEGETPSYQLGEEAWLDYSSPLTENPFAQSRAERQSVEKLSSLGLPTNLTALRENSALNKKENKELLVRALALRRHKRYNEATAIYKNFLAVNGLSQIALSELADMFRETKDNSIFEYLQGLRSNAESYPFARQDWAKTSGLLASMHVQRGEYSAAKQMYNEIIAQSPGNSDERHAQFQKFLLLLHVDGDKEGASQVLTDMASKYSSGLDIEFARHLLNASPDGSGQKNSGRKDGLDKSRLWANYPNPFNPSTTIVYQICKAGRVSLRVFDIVGREVATLVNKEQSEGIHTERFDASHLSSGVYFYQLIAPGVNDTRKMLITK